MLKYFDAKMKKNGFTIIEAMVAIFVILIGLIGGILAIQRTIVLTSISFDKLTAAYLAQEGVEIVRNIRDGNWLEARYRANPWNEGLACFRWFFIPEACEGDYTILGSEDPVLTRFVNKKLRIDSNGFYNYSSGSETKFSRKISIQQAGPDILDVSVEIFWDDRGKSYSYSLQEKLYNWK